MKNKHLLVFNRKGFVSIYAMLILYITIICVSIQFNRLKTYLYLQNKETEYDVFVLQSINKKIQTFPQNDEIDFKKSYKGSIVSFQWEGSKYDVECDSLSLKMFVYLNENRSSIIDYKYIN